MTYLDIIERREITMPDPETRFFGDGPVRSIPLHHASPAPAEYQIRSVNGRVIGGSSYGIGAVPRPGRQPKTVAPCDHHFVSKGPQQVRCTTCGRTLFRHLLPIDTVIHTFNRKPVEPTGPVKACAEGKTHRWRKYGHVASGQQRIQCTNCWCFANGREKHA